MSKSRVVQVEAESGVLAGNPLGDPHIRTLSIWLPPGYDDSERRYPVLWALAPFASWGQRLFNIQAWDENLPQRMDRLVREAKATPMIVAFPDCFTKLGGSQYVNSSAVGRYEDYVTQELVPLVDARFRTLASRDHRGVIGHSSGGFGALWLAMRHPDLFGATASHSGDMFFEHCYWPDIPGAVRGLQTCGGVEGFMSTFALHDRGKDWPNTLNLIAMSACYSPDPAAAHGFDLLCDPYTGEVRQDVWERWLAFDPVRIAPAHAEALRGLRALYFDCGIRDEYNLFLGARLLHRVLDEHHVRHIFEEFDGGHGNINWRFETSLPILASALAEG